MIAPKCSTCDAVHSFSVMRWGQVDASFDDGAWRVDNGPLCPEHANNEPEHYPVPALVDPTMVEADEAPVPNDDDLDEWIYSFGGELPEFVAACEARFVDEIVDNGGTAPHEDVEVPEKVLRSVAFEWYEQSKLNWSDEVGPAWKDGERHVWLVVADNDKEG